MPLRLPDAPNEMVVTGPYVDCGRRIRDSLPCAVGDGAGRHARRRLRLAQGELGLTIGRNRPSPTPSIRAEGPVDVGAA